MGVLDYALLVAIVVAKLVGLGATFRRSAHQLLLCVRFYLAYCLAIDLVQYLILERFGRDSIQYSNTYWTSDISIVVLGYFVLVRLVELAFLETRLRLPGLRTGAMLLFSGVATVTAFLVFRLHSSFSLGRFSVNLETNLSCLGMVLTLLLWVGVNVLGISSLRFRRVVLAFGVLYSSGAIAYTLMQLAPRVQVLNYAPPVSTLLGFWLVAYTLVTREPDLAPAKPRPDRLPPAIPAETT